MNSENKNPPHLNKSEDRPYDDIRTSFEHDVDEIIHSEIFRKLAGKMQLSSAIMGDALRNRLTHTLEVERIAHHISKRLGLNLELTKAIAFGHDIGHPPFGHSGERTLDSILRSHGHSGFDHAFQSYRVCEYYYEGITSETKSGIKHHTFNIPEYFTNDINSLSPEGQVVRLSDAIAFINSDIEDGKRLEILNDKDLNRLLDEKPNELGGLKIKDLSDSKYLDIIIGEPRDRIGSSEKLIIEANEKDENLSLGIVQPDNKMLTIFGLLKRKIIEGKMYIDPEIKYKDEFAKRVIKDVYNHIMNPKSRDQVAINANEWIDDRIKKLEKRDIYEPKKRDIGHIRFRQITDYLAQMTDQEIYSIWSSIFVYKGII